MTKIKNLLFTLLCFGAFNAFGQAKYLKTPEDKIIDSITYIDIKTKKIQQMKGIFPSKEVTIKESFKEVRRTPDSVIYSYEWVVNVSDLKEEKIFDSNSYLNKEFKLPTFTTFDNKKINITNLKGKPTLINFWFTTCTPCIEEMPILNQIKEQLKDSANFIAITYESSEKVRNFLQRHKFNFTHITNAKKYIESMDIGSFPLNIFLDKNGIVRKIENGIPYKIEVNDDKEIKIMDGKDFLETLRKLM